MYKHMLKNERELSSMDNNFVRMVKYGMISTLNYVKKYFKNKICTWSHEYGSETYLCYLYIPETKANHGCVSMEIGK